GVSNPFAMPTQFSNVILIVEEKKLHVSKELLAMHSPVFAALFFGEFALNGKDKLGLNDIVYEEFVDLLNVIHPSLTPITELSVPYILKLSVQFQMRGVVALCENFLKATTQFNIGEKMMYADNYNLHELKNHCLQSIPHVYGLHEITSSPEYDNFSDAMKVSICDRMRDLLAAHNS
ncbi:hypothetical protein PMAYCL1PPCAC_25991, partial [Pristionchus mayeri]